MMTATDELRKLLDERGVEWTAGDDEYDRKTHWESSGLTWEYFNDDNGDAWLGFLGACESDVSPEQAIAATLGVWTCHIEHEYTGTVKAYEHMCDVCGEFAYTFLDEEPPNFCPNCGRWWTNEQV